MREKNYMICYFILFFLITSCSKKNTVNLTIENANGLEKNNKVIYHGKEIGKVKNIQFIGRKLNIELQLQEDFLIPIGSKISLISTDILGSRAIAIEFSNENHYYSSDDTLVCYDNSATRLDSTLNIINSAIQEIKDSIPDLIKTAKE